MVFCASCYNPANLKAKWGYMSLQATLIEIIGRLRQGRFQNEQAVSQGIVLPILKELDWNVFDTTLVWPEYQTGEGRVDFALCHPPSKPISLIEVKPTGRAEEGVRQALEYAFHTGVQFIILTDGLTWSFYLPSEQGSYEDRRVYKLDLFERPSGEAAETLNRYLAKTRIESGVALETARREYRSRNRRSQARAAIPEAWRELVEKGDEYLMDVLASAVESKVGIRPEMNDVANFLTAFGKTVVSGATSPEPPVDPGLHSGWSNSDEADSSGRAGKLVLLNKTYPYQNAKDAMVIVLRELAKRDETFLERCSHHPNAQGRKRRYIARKAEELYPDREDLRDMCESITGDWLVATNMNNILKRSIIKLASEVAGLAFGKDVVVEL